MARTYDATPSILREALNTAILNNISKADIMNVWVGGDVKFGRKFAIIRHPMYNFELGINPLIHRINTIRITKHNTPEKKNDIS